MTRLDRRRLEREEKKRKAQGIKEEHPYRKVQALPIPQEPRTLDPKPRLPWLHPLRRKALLKLAGLFIVNDLKGSEVITEGQLRIFEAIIFRTHKRVQIICSTQYGKSLWVALACLIVACVQGKRIAVVAPSDEKAKLIMRYFVEHLGDHVLFSSKLEKNTRLERLKQEESKERIILNNGGGIFVISAQQKNASASIEAAMGQGAEIVIGDEYGLIQDRTEATIFRMIAGKGPDAFYCKIGNPFYSMLPYTHFKESWESLRYHRIFIDYVQALAEGRYSYDFIEEAKRKPLFDVLFGCEFPPEDVMDEKGYLPLVLSKWFRFGITPEILKGIIEKDLESEKGLRWKVKGGGDISGGGDRNYYVVRYGRFACRIAENVSEDTMTQVAEIQRIAEEYHIRPEDFNIDDIGVGHGVTDRLHELGFMVNGVNVGESARDSDTFFNKKAELCWEARNWFLDPEHRIDEHDDWSELTWLRYKTVSDRRVQMEPKPDLKKRTKKSPDCAEAFYLTFDEAPFVGFA
jgi:hypothetical protein